VKGLEASPAGGSSVKIASDRSMQQSQGGFVKFTVPSRPGHAAAASTSKKLRLGGPWLPCCQVPVSLGLMFLLLWKTFSGSYLALISASRR
jgi:hypothetical protein